MGGEKINDLKKLMGPLVGQVVGQEEMIVSLFIVSKKSPRLKMLDLSSKLNSDERSKKLHKWAQDHRLVAVIEKGDQVFAHANAKYANQLQSQQDLTINGKKVTSVNALSDEEYDQLAIVDAAFEEYVLHNPPVEEKKNAKPQNDSTAHSAIREFLASNSLLSDQIHMAYLFSKMKNLPDQIILNCLVKMTESRREIEKQRKVDQRKQDILQDEIKKGIRKEEIVKGEIKGQDLKGSILSENEERVNRTRGLPEK